MTAVAPVDEAWKQAAIDMAAKESTARIRERHRAAVKAFNQHAGYERAALGEPGRTDGASRLLSSAVDTFMAGRQAVVVLAGPVGTGKTRAGFAVLNHLVDTPAPPAVRWGSEMDLLGRSRWAEDRLSDASEAVAGTEVLLIDDVGCAVTMRRDDERHAVWQALLDAIGRAGRFLLIVTTNLSPVADGVTGEVSPWEWWIGPMARSRMDGMGGFADGSYYASTGRTDWRRRPAHG